MFFLHLYPYKCKRYMKIMNKYITLYHIILCTWVLLFKNHSPPSITPNLSRLQICEFKRNGFLNFFLFITLWYPYKGKNYASSHLSSLPLSSRLSKRNVNFSKDLVPFTPQTPLPTWVHSNLCRNPGATLAQNPPSPSHHQVHNGSLSHYSSHKLEKARKTIKSEISGGQNQRT